MPILVSSESFDRGRDDEGHLGGSRGGTRGGLALQTVTRPSPLRVLKRRSGLIWTSVTAGLLAASGVLSATPASAASASPGQVSAWGFYAGGPSVLTPAAVGNLSNVVTVDASNNSGYALESDGTVWAWGGGQYGDLGDGNDAPSFTNAVEVRFPAGVDIVAIGEAAYSGMAVDSTGQGWEWGQRHCHGASKSTTLPTKVVGVTNAVAVQGAGHHVHWLLANGTVASCGVGTNSELGLGPVMHSLDPMVIPGLSNIVAISAGNNAVAALDSSGDVYAWGDNNNGEVGVGGTTHNIWVPTKVNLPAKAVEISSGGDVLKNGHMLALLSTGQVYAWGTDTSGQLGDGRHADESSPVQVPLPPGVTFTSVIASGRFSMGLDTNGNVWAWGGGAIGNGNDGGSKVPVMIDSGVVQISGTAGTAVDLHS